MPFRLKQPSVLPGFDLALGYTLLYMSLIVLIPLSAVFLKTAQLSWEQFWAIATAPRVLASYRLTFGASLIAALVNTGAGAIVAWVLVRYHFPGRRLVDAMVDLPFALPTAVAGIALSALYAGNGWIGGLLAPLGIKVALVVFYIWILHQNPKFVAIDKEADDDIMHFLQLGETNGLANQPFDPRPQG